MNLKSILYLPTRYFPAISGAEFYLQRMAEIFTSKSQYKIDIYTSNAIDFKALRDPNGKIIRKERRQFEIVNNLKINRYSINYNRSLEEKITKIEKIPVYNSLELSNECLKKFLNNGPYLEELIDFFLKSENLNYDLIHTTFFPYFNLIISLIIGKLVKKPVVLTPFFHFSNPRYLDPSLLEVINKFDLLITCTNLEKKFLMNKIGVFEKKIKIIPMGVDYKKFENNHKKNTKNYSLKENFFRNGEKKFKIVLFCGYKNYEKGALSILKAIPYILEKIKKIYFVFIGPSTMAYNRELSKIIKRKNVNIINLTPDNLTGYFDKKKIAAFKEADIYLMPSRSDAFGIGYLEAWAAEKPVIGANIGATPEVIRDNVDGFLVEFDNPVDIAEKVIRLLKYKKLRKKLGSFGKLKVIQNNTWKIIAEKTHKVYQDLIYKYEK
ncbi:MAG: glycosyltransferase family 4 protein [Promethearchaeota archaeon]